MEQVPADAGARRSRDAPGGAQFPYPMRWCRCSRERPEMAREGRVIIWHQTSTIPVPRDSSPLSPLARHRARRRVPRRASPCHTASRPHQDSRRHRASRCLLASRSSQAVHQEPPEPRSLTRLRISPAPRISPALPTSPVLPTSPAPCSRPLALPPRITVRGRASTVLASTVLVSTVLVSPSSRAVASVSAYSSPVWL